VKRILYLTDQMLTVFLVQGHRYMGKQQYSPDSEGLAAFDRDIGEAPEILNRLVLDVTEEEFYIEKVPHVFFHDQVKILERRRAQRFGTNAWVRMEKQGRENEGRRDDLFLFSGITRPEMLQPWLAILHRHCSPLQIITSVPLLSHRLYHLMRLKQEHVLFVSHGESGGIRQSYLVEGHLQQSRLAPTPRMTERDYAEHFMQEVQRMVQFLTSNGSLSYGKTLHVYLLGSNEVIAILGRELVDTEQIRIHGYNLLALERKFGFRDTGRNEQADTFFALLAATRKRFPAYTTTEDRIGFYHYRARQVFLAASLVVFLGGTAFMGHLLDRMFIEKSVLERMEFRIAGEQKKLIALEEELDRYEASGFEMEDAIRVYDWLKKVRTRPFEWFALVGNSLMEHDSIRLHKVGFYVARVPQEAGDDTAWVEKLGVEGMEEEEWQEQPIQADDWMDEKGNDMDPVHPAAPLPAPVVVLEGVMARGESYRAMMSDFRALVHALEENPRLARVLVEKWPVEVRPDRPLDMQQSELQFGLPLSFKLVLVGRRML